MNDEQFEQLLRTVGQEHHRPGTPPREAMWAKIQAGRQAKRVIPLAAPRRPWRQPLAWVTGAAALLALGVGLGRLSVRPGAGAGAPDTAAGTSPIAAANHKPAAAAAYAYATSEHLGQTEIFLTLFRSFANQPSISALTVPTARQLLATNRLLLSSPAAADQATRLLLEDVELVLAMIVQLSPNTEVEYRTLITRSMDQTGILPRLRMEIPANAEMIPDRGAL